MIVLHVLLATIVIQSFQCTSEVYESDSVSITFVDQNINDYHELDFSNISSFDNIPFRNNCLTKIFMHGINNNKNSDINKLGVKVFREKKYCVNILVVDWSYYFPNIFFSYGFSFLSTKEAKVKNAGNILYEKLKLLIDLRKIDIDRIHLLGHSMGAHLAGVVGYRFGGKLPRITGFDPAGLFFSLKDYDISRSALDMYLSTKLTKNAAKYVEIIHSNYDAAGTKELWAHANIFVGRGESQQCSSRWQWANQVVCKHSVAFLLFYESIRDPYRLPLIRCNSIEDIIEYRCENMRLVQSYLGQEVINVEINTGLFTVDEVDVFENINIEFSIWD